MVWDLRQQLGIAMFPFASLFLTSISRALKLSNISASKTEITGVTAVAGVRLNSDGNIQRRQGIASTYTTISADEWINDDSEADPAFDPSLYEGGYFGVTGDVGALSGTTDSYLSLDTIRTWSLSRSSIGSESVSGTLKVRQKSDISNEVTCTMSLSVTVTSG